MKLKLVAVAVAALAVSAGAQASFTYSLGTVSGMVPFGATVLTGSFTDTLNFSIASLSTVTVTVRNTSYSAAPLTLGKITQFAASLDGVPLTLSLSTTTESGVDVVVQRLFVGNALKVAGPHTLTIGGVGDAFSSAYIGQINVTPVPEPETYALMLAGLGAVGFLARRRRGA